MQRTISLTSSSATHASAQMVQVAWHAPHSSRHLASNATSAISGRGWVLRMSWTLTGLLPVVARMRYADDLAPGIGRLNGTASAPHGRIAGSPPVVAVLPLPHYRVARPPAVRERVVGGGSRRGSTWRSPAARASSKPSGRTPAGMRQWYAPSPAAGEPTPGARCGCPPCSDAGPRVASPPIAMVTLLLGPLEVRNEAAPVKLGGRKARALLARLALDANRTVPAERLIEDLWGEDPPETAAKMVQIHVSQLRKVLPSGVVVTRPGGYAFALDPESIDLVRFERLRDVGRGALAAGDAVKAGRLLGEALALWRGEALAEFSEPLAGLGGGRLPPPRPPCLAGRHAAAPGPRHPPAGATQ